MPLQLKKIAFIAAKLNFFLAHNQTILTKIVYDKLNFGKRFINCFAFKASADDENFNASANIVLPSVSMIVDFVKGFHDFEH